MQPRHRELLEMARGIADSKVKVEVSGDTVIMQASPSAIHQRNLTVVRRQFDTNLPMGYLPSENTDLESPKSVTLFSEPENGRYRLREDAAFGETVHIPAPFSFTLDTTGLLPY